MMKNIFLWSLVLSSSLIHSKVLLITHSYNRPEFIEIHVKTFGEFLTDDYEYVVFNDAPNESMKNQIEEMCKKHGVKCFRIPQELHKTPWSPGNRHSDGIMYSLEQIGFNFNGIVCFIDSDLFLVKSFSIEKYMQEYDLAAELVGRENETIKIRHLSPILCFMNMETLPNKHTLSFEGGYVLGVGVDVGGNTYHYLVNNPSIRSQFFTLMYLPALKKVMSCNSCTNFSCATCKEQLMNYYNFDQDAINFINACPDDNMEFVLNNHFMHYRCGSNWNNKSPEYHAMKMKALNDYIAHLLYTKYYHMHAFHASI
jgi:hypothetical protein